MRNRIARYSATLVAGVFALGVFGAATGGAAVAGTVLNTHNEAGYRAGNGNWRFRFVQTEFTVPENVCSDSYVGAGVMLAGVTNNVALGVGCHDGFPFAGYGFGSTSTTNPFLWTRITSVAADDVIFAQIYYDVANNHVFLYEYDKTTHILLTNDSFNAHSALYKWATAATWVTNPLHNPPAPGTSFILVPFTDTHVTSYDGTRGSGISGRWGAHGLQAVHGSHVIAAAPLLYHFHTQFNVRLFGNS